MTALNRYITALFFIGGSLFPLISSGQVKEFEFGELYVLKACPPSTIRDVLPKNGYSLLPEKRTANNEVELNYYYSNHGKIPFAKSKMFIDFEYPSENSPNQSRVFYTIPETSSKYFYKFISDLGAHGYILNKIEKVKGFEIYEYFDKTLFINLWHKSGYCYIDMRWAKK